jgi:hypothetical protein
MKPATAFAALLLLSCLMALALPPAVLAQTVTPGSPQLADRRDSADEIRQYDVLVKDKPVGHVTIRISPSTDGSVTTTTDTSIEASFLFITYRYEFHGRELWQGDRLVQLDSRANDNGTAMNLQAATDARGSRINIAGKPNKAGPPLAMTTNYWRLPAADFAAGSFSLIEPDSGVLRTSRLQFVGPDNCTVEGRQVMCNHYRLSGDAAAELWFDGEGRMVRQQTVEQGYPTEQRLVKVRSEQKPAAAGPAVLTGYQK